MLCVYPSSLFSDVSQDEEVSDLIRLKKMTRMAHLLVADVKASAQQYRDIFRETLNIDYVELIVKVFQAKLSKAAKPVVEATCQRLVANPKESGASSPYSWQPSAIINVAEFDFRVGTRLFELYLALKQIQDLSQQYSHGSEEGLSRYHMWFLKAVAKWLDIALVRSIRRIMKAVSLDDLK